MFMISSGIYLIGTLIYWFWASGEVQPWAQQPTENGKTVQRIGENSEPTKATYVNEALEMKE